MNMKTALGALVAVSLLVIGFALGHQWVGEPTMTVEPPSNERKVLYYKAPMDPNYRRDKPGKSPMGMDLVPVYANDSDETAKEGAVNISPTVVNNLGIRTEPVEVGALPRRIETVGYVAYDEDQIVQISTRVDGWIEVLNVKASGDPIEVGQSLFELYSPTLVNAQEEYLAALSSRLPDLREASRERLSALGLTERAIERLDRDRAVERRIHVIAESNGVVSHLGVRQGQYITAATEVMSIADLESVWLLAEVFERQSAWIETGQVARVELDYQPGKTFEGRVDYVYPELDPMSRTLKVRIRFENPLQTLRPNMFARVTLFAPDTGVTTHIPRQALIPSGREDRVVVALEDGAYRSRAVRVGIESGDRVEILSGLDASDRVVVSGQFLIDSESNIESALARLTPKLGETNGPTAHDMKSMDAADHQHEGSVLPRNGTQADREAEGPLSGDEHAEHQAEKH